MYEVDAGAGQAAAAAAQATGLPHACASAGSCHQKRDKKAFADSNCAASSAGMCFRIAEKARFATARRLAELRGGEVGGHRLPEGHEGGSMLGLQVQRARLPGTCTATPAATAAAPPWPSTMQHSPRGRGVPKGNRACQMRRCLRCSRHAAAALVSCQRCSDAVACSHVSCAGIVRGGSWPPEAPRQLRGGLQTHRAVGSRWRRRLVGSAGAVLAFGRRRGHAAALRVLPPACGAALRTCLMRVRAGNGL